MRKQTHAPSPRVKNGAKGGIRSPLKLLICVPTYNEAENIAPFLDAVFANAPLGAHVLVVDDNSPDGTARIVERAREKHGERLRLLERPGKQGGASAFLQAFDWGIKNNFDAMLAMDADFSHDPKYIKGIAEKAACCDVVIGSRLVKGGGIENRSFARNVLSAGASWYCRLFLSPRIKDWTGGYNLWSKHALEKIDTAGVFTRGYSFQLEMKYKALRSKCRVTEVPIMFPDRKAGRSKMSASYFVKALADVWRIKFACIKNKTLKQMFKFAVTGGLGTITNLLIFFLCADIANLPEIPVSAGCFIVAGAQNYILHHRWSFIENTGGTKPSFKKWLVFMGSSLLGLAVNITVMTFIIARFAPPYKFIAQAAGIAAGMIINFVISKLVVFKSKITEVHKPL